jgi:hypothetical protein
MNENQEVPMPTVVQDEGDEEEHKQQFFSVPGTENMNNVIVPMKYWVLLKGCLNDARNNVKRHGREDSVLEALDLLHDIEILNTVETQQDSNNRTPQWKANTARWMELADRRIRCKMKKEQYQELFGWNRMHSAPKKIIAIRDCRKRKASTN